ncbi:MAG: dihydrofolate reductase family protein [Methanothrix sp.]|nr:dihydrofolate reductase family protein [Methanothrix sp.]
MRRIVVFNNVTVDGFFAGPNGEIDWFKADRDPEYDEFSRAQSKTGDALIFGRTTYQMMESYWPTPDAMKSNPDMAEVMNGIEKIVFSRTLKSVEEGPHWRNVRLLHEIKSEEILELKEQEGKDIAILGSGSIVRQLTNLALIDEYQLIVHPIILGSGKSLFAGVETKNLRLMKTRAFKNGIVWLCYHPSK